MKGKHFSRGVRTEVFFKGGGAYGSVMVETRTAAQEVGEDGGGIYNPWPNTAFT